MKAGALGFLLVATVLGGVGVAGTAAAEPIHICVDIDALVDLELLAFVEGVLQGVLDQDLEDLPQFVYEYAVDLFFHRILSQLVLCALDLPVDLPQPPPFPQP